MQTTTARQPIPLAPPRPNERITGEVRDALNRYGVHLQWDGHKLEGRLGGWLLGERVRLEFDGQELLGTVWSGLVRLTVRARFVPSDANTGTLEVRLIGSSYINTVTLEVQNPRAAGDHMHFDLTDRGLTGSSTTATGTQHIQLHAHLPKPVLVALAVVVDAVNREASKVALENLRSMGDA